MNSSHAAHLRFLHERYSGVPNVYAETFVGLYAPDEHLLMAEQTLAGELEPALHWPCVLGVLAATWHPINNDDNSERQAWSVARQGEIAARLIRIVLEKLDDQLREDLCHAAGIVLMDPLACFHPLAFEVFSGITPVLMHESSGTTTPFSADLAAHYGLPCPEWLNTTVSYVERPTPQVLGSGHLNVPGLATTLLRAPLVASFAAQHGLNPNVVANAVQVHLFAALMHLKAGRRVPSAKAASETLSGLAGDGGWKSEVSSAHALLSEICRLRRSCGQICLKLSSAEHPRVSAQTALERTP
jgi:hypothetical protein